MSGFYAVLWRDYLFFKRRFKTITLGSMISPILYLLTFGLGLGKSVKMAGLSYIDFLIPGLLALSSMNNAFNSIATPLTLARLSDKSLEEYICAPITDLSFTIAKVLSGALRGMYAALLILIVSFVFEVKLNLTPLFFLMLFLNCLVFASLGFFMSMVIKSHMDMARFRNFVITPMVFVCGTFFSLEDIPEIIRFILKILPLTPASYGLRATALQGNLPFWTLLVQFTYLFLFLSLGLYAYKKVE